VKKLKNISTFNAFRNRNYTLYFSGQSVSLIGTWMQRTGVSWVVYSITDSAFMLGVTVFAQQIPSSLLSLFGGFLSDRYDRYKILLITQTASMLQALALAIMVLTNHFNVPVILALSVVLGIINAFDVPARQPLVHELVTNKEDLPNALALNSSMVNVARLIGPALSGIVLERYGAGICFLINGISFFAVLASLVMLKLPEYKPRPTKGNLFKEMADGFDYIKRTPAISMVLLMLAVISLLVLPYDTLVPVFAKVVFKGNATTFGYIFSFIGLGAISGTFFLASLKKETNLKVVLFVNAFILGVGLMLFSQISYFPLAMVFAVITGFGSMSQNTICLTLLQVNAEAHMRGRVMSYMALAFFGMLPLGSLLVGYISQQVGAPITLFCQGIIAVIIGIVFSKLLRPNKLNKKEIDRLGEIEDQVIRKI
jgi:MFS family permease